MRLRPETHAAIGRAVALFTVLCAAHLPPGEAYADEPSEEGAPTVHDDESLPVVQVSQALDEAKTQLESGERVGELRFAGEYDWVRTTSDEWVRGNIDWMRDGILSFDSEEFGEVEINMREVAEIHAARTNTYVLADRSTLIGPAIVSGTKIAVQTENGVVIKERNQIWSIVEGGGRELDYWSMTLDVGLGLNRGNSNQADVNLRFELNRDGKRTMTQVIYLMNLGYADGEVNVGRHVVSFGNRVWLTRVWFVEPIVGQLLSDRFQDTRFRAQPAATGGVRFLDVPGKALWDIAIGFGYQYLKLFDPLPTVNNPQQDGLTRFETRARFDFTPDVYFTMSWVSNLTFTLVRNTNHTGIAELFFEVTNLLYFQTTFLYLRTEEPWPRADSTLPAKNDFFLTFGISLQLG
ncbi:MAG: DUF481 domain-containing protein [Myxococcota bacterium]